MRRPFSRLRDEEGTAITEMAIMLPALLIIFFWCLFFTDISLVRLKVLEATRMAVWETTVFRSPSAIKSDVEARFQDLRSSDTDKTTKPKGFMTLNDVKVNVSVQSNLEHPFVGQADFGDKGGAATKVVGSINKGLDWILNYMGMNTKARAKATVSISVQNDLIPKNLHILDNRIDDDVLTRPLVFKSQGGIVFDTWKAWPHRASGTTSNAGNETDVYRSYPVAEKYVADKVKNIAFFGLNKVSIFDTAAKVVDKLGMPVPWLVSSFQADHEGPIAMLPAAPISESWVPGHGMKPYKAGQLTFNNYAKAGPGTFDTPAQGVDRARPTLPYKIASAKWSMSGGSGGNILGAVTGSCNGGYCKTELSSGDAENAYYQSYQCRGHFYEGMTNATGKPGSAAFFNLVGASKNYNGCEDAADSAADTIAKWGSGLGSLLGGG